MIANKETPARLTVITSYGPEVPFGTFEVPYKNNLKVSFTLMFDPSNANDQWKSAAMSDVDKHALNIAFDVLEAMSKRLEVSDAPTASS